MYAIRSYYARNDVFFSITCVITPDPKPSITDATVNANANRKLTIPANNIKVSGLIRGEDVKKAITGPQGSAVLSNPITTAIVPQAQSGVNAPKNTLVPIDTFA